jgi:hypothetical protein
VRFQRIWDGVVGTATLFVLALTGYAVTGYGLAHVDESDPTMSMLKYLLPSVAGGLLALWATVRVVERIREFREERLAKRRMRRAQSHFPQRLEEARRRA